MRMRKPFLAAGLCAAALVVSMAWAAGDGYTEAEAPGADPQYAEAVAAIKAQQYERAIPLLQAFIQRSPPNANAENWLGYSYRKAGRLEPALVHYQKALKLDPKHRGAHEYIGEAYLMANDLAKAEEHLKILDRLCTFSCEEYRLLKKSIAEYKAKRPQASR